MSNTDLFVERLSHDASLDETDIAIQVAWFLSTIAPDESATIRSVCDFIESNGIRTNINRSRLQRRLTACRDASAPKGKPIVVTARKRRELAETYSDCLSPPLPEISNTILDASDFEQSREYVRSIVKQVNGTYQFHFFDSCAVMMRRLVEILIIDAYASRNEDKKIRDGDGNLLMLNGLIGALKSGQTFKLSRNAPAYLETIKLLGDTAAHSRNYVTKKKDIDEFSQKYRMLIEEIKNLV